MSGFHFFRSSFRRESRAAMNLRPSAAKVQRYSLRVFTSHIVERERERAVRRGGGGDEAIPDAARRCDEYGVRFLCTRLFIATVKLPSPIPPPRAIIPARPTEPPPQPAGLLLRRSEGAVEEARDVAFVPSVAFVNSAAHQFPPPPLRESCFRVGGR